MEDWTRGERLETGRVGNHGTKGGRMEDWTSGARLDEWGTIGRVGNDWTSEGRLDEWGTIGRVGLGLLDVNSIANFRYRMASTN